MPGRSISRRAMVALTCAVTFASVVPAPVALAGSDNRGDDGATTTTVVDNVFLPEKQDLDECISSLPKPGCGSTARGGWRQTLVFGVMLGGMAAIGVRIAYAVRRRDRRRTGVTPTPDSAQAPRT